MHEIYIINKLDQCIRMLNDLEEKVDRLDKRLSEIESRMQPVYVVPEK